MSKSFSFLGADEFEQHSCKAIREGEWLVFKCPQCAYERRFNNSTGEMEVQKGNPGAMHQGQYLPVGIDFSALSAN